MSKKEKDKAVLGCQTHHHHHHHNHAENLRGKKLLWVTLLNFSISLVQVAGGIISNSLSLFRMRYIIWVIHPLFLLPFWPETCR